jgi:hypothetical protein
MLVSPVRLQSPDSFERAESVQRTTPPRKAQEKQDVSRFSTSAVTLNKDVIALTSGLDHDLESAKKTVTHLFDRVREQLTATFGFRGAEKDDAAQFLPPDNATGKEIQSFFSPENTAKRIVSFATGFVGSYLQNHGGEANEENVAAFSTLISDAIKEGFANAKKILGNPDSESEVGSNIEKTFKLVLKGIEEFQQSFLDRSPVPTASEEVTVVKELVDQKESELDLVQTKPYDTSDLEKAFADKEPINLEPLTNPDAEQQPVDGKSLQV